MSGLLHAHRYSSSNISCFCSKTANILNLIFVLKSLNTAFSDTVYTTGFTGHPLVKCEVRFLVLDKHDAVRYMRNLNFIPVDSFNQVPESLPWNGIFCIQDLTDKIHMISHISLSWVTRDV